jgi:hypothetical protein
MADNLANAVATPVPSDAEEWLKSLSKAMQDRRNGREGSRVWARHLSKPARIRPGLDLLNDYLVGDPPLMNYAVGWDDLFRVIARLGRLNMAELIINAKSSKMKLNGFRTAAADDDLGDAMASDIMRANRMKILAREVHDFQLWAGDGYAMVTPNDGEIPVITAEDPRETITAHDPATGEDPGRSQAVPRRVGRRRPGAPLHREQGWNGRPLPAHQEGPLHHLGWGVPVLEGMGAHRAGVGQLDRMPLVRFRNRGGRGEFERHLDTLDRINDQIMSKVVIAKVQAFRQMAIENLPDTVTQIDAATGEPEEVEIDYSDAFEATPGSMWRLPEGAKIWESTPTDLGPLRLSIKDDLENLASVTQTALPAITPDAASGSAEGASLMREEHVGAVEACMDYAEVGWAEVMSIAFAFMGDEERANITKIEPIRGPIERFSFAERADAASKAVTTLPRAAIQTDIWQYPPAEVARLRQLDGADLLHQQAAAAAGQAQPGQAPPVAFQPPNGGTGDTGATA